MGMNLISTLLKLFTPKPIPTVVTSPTPAPHITLEDYLTSSGLYSTRAKSPECTSQVVSNATELLKRVNALLGDCIPGKPVQVSSGFRTAVANKLCGGSPKSGHLTGQAIDIRDVGEQLDTLLTRNADLLEKYNLWREAPNATFGWTHLDIKPRRNRTFNP